MAVAVILFLYVWSLGFGLGTLFSSNGTINGREANASELQGMRVSFFLIGLAVFAGATYLLARTLNERIEIEGEDIVWYDWKGSKAVASSSGRIMGSNHLSVAKTTIQTEDGEIRLHQSLNDAGILKSIVSKAADGFGNWRPGKGAQASGTYYPEAWVHHYRGTYMHFFSFLWLGVIGFFFVSMFQINAGKPFSPSTLIMPLFLVIFIVPGVWMQLTSWNEKITIGPDGIEWIDLWGKSRVVATIDEIVSMDVQPGEVDILRVFTQNGTVQASSHLKNFGLLKMEVNRILDSRGVE